MADEAPKEHSEEIQGILSDLDSILSGLNTDAARPAPSAEPVLSELPQLSPEAAPPPPPPPEPAPAPFIQAFKPEAAPPPPPPPPPPAPAPVVIVEAPKPAPPPPPPAPAPVVIVEAPKPAPPPPPPPAPEPVVVVEAPKPEPAPPPPAPAPVVEAFKPYHPPPPSAAAPAPAVEAPAAAAQEAPVIDVPPPVLAAIPDKAPKNQIRRVAIIYTTNYVKERDEFIKFLDKVAETLSKRPLYLRKVYVEIFRPGDNARVFLEKIKSFDAVGVIGILESLPEAKINELSEVLAEANIFFRNVAAADVKKKSVCVDLVVDMMLLGHEA